MMSEHPELPDLIRKTGVPVPQVLDRSGETLAWKPAEDMAPKVEAISQKDFATETTLAQVLTKLSGDPATATKQDSVKAVLDAISQKDFATETTLAQVLTKLTDGTQQVQLTGTLTELFGASLSDRPPASSVSVGATFMVVGTDIVYQSNGTDWVVISE